MDQTELFSQIKHGNLNNIQDILNNNPSLLNQFYYGVTPLMYSIECEKEEIALYLCNNPKIDLNLKDNLNSTLLEKAIEFKMYKVIEEIVKFMQKTSLNNTILDNGETYLTSSIKLDDQNISISLIKGNIDVYKPNKMNQYPIQLAIKYYKIEILKEMLKVDNIFIGTLQNGYNPLLDACENDLTDIALILIENGADVNVRDQDQSWTPLMYAICNNNETLVSKLLEKKCGLDQVDFNGNTVVHLAVLTENDYILKLLLNSNAKKNSVNLENLTPLDIAKSNEDENSIKLLS